jgi:hypothetical protein
VLKVQQLAGAGSGTARFRLRTLLAYPGFRSLRMTPVPTARQC